MPSIYRITFAIQPSALSLSREVNALPRQPVASLDRSYPPIETKVARFYCCRLRSYDMADNTLQQHTDRSIDEVQRSWPAKLGVRDCAVIVRAVQKVRSWITAVGAKTAFIEHGSPWENGYCESLNARSRDELLNREIFIPLREAQTYAFFGISDLDCPHRACSRLATLSSMRSLGRFRRTKACGSGA